MTEQFLDTMKSFCIPSATLNWLNDPWGSPLVVYFCGVSCRCELFLSKWVQCTALPTHFWRPSSKAAQKVNHIREPPYRISLGSSCCNAMSSLRIPRLVSGFFTKLVKRHHTVQLALTSLYDWFCWCLISSPSCPVGFSIQDVARSALQGAFYHVGVI